ncbi:PREDICTED: S-methyl-5'-thioadenosine phosphorylase-like isoform X2 [Habropoda laboriosa]|uniref:S-methyl-5'-thioadenosine phosphorylase-like isoform X2 n=1 Tax=Habropoda laboriosa TaxID=597456 RepID=UPI00083E5E49|nr:PREDICTED: S-methyl-5'-thioadenosine phosphorylase-like isoform X2 [Habropoda laboriosa]
MNNYKIKVGIIGGSGLGDPQNQILKCQTVTTREEAKNDFGLPSSDLYHGSINNVDVILLSRGQLVIPDSFLDRTIKRSTTFYDGTSSKYSGVCHMPMEPAFDPSTSQILFEVGKELGYSIQKGGTVVTIEGPRFSSKAESNALRLWGGQLVNMTTCPEVYLAKEAGLLYAAVAMATDYDCWRDCGDKVHAADVVAVFKQNVNKIKEILTKAVKIIGERNWDKEIDALQELCRSSNVSS